MVAPSRPAGTRAAVTVGDSIGAVGNIGSPRVSQPARNAVDSRRWRASTAGSASSSIIAVASRKPSTSDTGGVNGVSPLSSDAFIRRKSKKNRGTPRAAHGADAGEVGDHAGRAFIVHAHDRAIRARAQPRGDRGGIGRLTPGDLQPIDPRGHRFGAGGKALAEVSVFHSPNVVAGS